MELQATGEVVKLDRGFPLVQLPDGTLVRCKHATALVKGEKQRAVIGDRVHLSIPEKNDKALIVGIEPRRSTLIRKDPAERTLPQVLAANFDVVIVAQPLADVNLRRLERELVLAHETGAKVCIVLTKADLAQSAEEVEQTRQTVALLAGPQVETLVASVDDPQSIEAVRRLINPGSMAVLIGRSGVGKSSLINLLVGEDILEIGEVRVGDGKGRHTTVSREIIDLPGGGRIVDMPGVRGLGLWDAEAGLEAAFPDVEALAAQCKFRDCNHVNEPGCAVREAVESGKLSEVRLQSYKALKQELENTRERREQARWQSHDRSPYGRKKPKR